MSKTTGSDGISGASTRHTASKGVQAFPPSEGQAPQVDGVTEVQEGLVSVEKCMVSLCRDSVPGSILDRSTITREASTMGWGPVFNGR